MLSIPQRYYSSMERKYLQIHITGGNLNQKKQQRILEDGFQLASLLNRTLILPKFSCKTNSICDFLEKYSVDKWFCRSEVCNFRGRFPGRIRLLDVAMGTGYREHVFLHNPRVPDDVKESVSRTITIPSQLHLHSNRFVLAKSTLHTFLSKFNNYSVLSVNFEDNIVLHFNETIAQTMKQIFN